jgi:ribosomal protein S18 acetylase RimI-like enzyme
VSELRITPERAGGPLALALLARYYAELDSRFPGGFELERTVAAPADELTPPRGLFLVATLDGAAVGCGAVRLLDADVAEIKRMWVDPGARGAGVGRALLASLEAGAVELGAHAVRLDTAASLTEALGLYRSAGYREIAAYNDNPYAAHWLERSLD